MENFHKRESDCKTLPGEVCTRNTLMSNSRAIRFDCKNLTFCFGDLISWREMIRLVDWEITVKRWRNANWWESNRSEQNGGSLEKCPYLRTESAEQHADQKDWPSKVCEGTRIRIAQKAKSWNRYWKTARDVAEQLTLKEQLLNSTGQSLRKMMAFKNYQMRNDLAKRNNSNETSCIDEGLDSKNQNNL